MRIAIVYDCLYPHTVGGAERWYRQLARRLAAAGHDVTYLTLRQWERGQDAGFDGVKVRAVGPRMALYAGGRRRILPPVVFGLGVGWHLLRRGRRIDVVHTASFPYFSLLAAAGVRRVGRFDLVVDWHEAWTREYWVEYLGRLRGRIGWAVQGLCVRVGQRAFCFSRLYAERLRRWGLRGPLRVLEGQYDGDLTPREPQPAEPLVVFAGRHIPEKRVPVLIPAIAAAQDRIPDLRAEILGDGPDRPRVQRLVAEHGLEHAIGLPGFVAAPEVERTLARALCLALPSRREGYGLVVLEASAVGTPSLLVAGPDNAATELVEDGVNGLVVDSADPEALAEAIVQVHAAGDALRASTAAWFADHARRLSLAHSLEAVVEAYAGGDGRPLSARR